MIYYSIFILTLISIFLYHKFKAISAYKIINLWNYFLTNFTDQQNRDDSYNYDTAPGLQHAPVSKHSGIRKLHNLISTNHNQILKEVGELVKSGYTGFPMNEMDNTQGDTFKEGAKGWRPLWVKFLGTYAGTADRLPTLKGIVQEMGDDVILLHVSMFYPGTTLIPHRGISKGNLRYHYGLIIPKGDVGLRIEKCVYRWKTGEGIQFDDTHWHSAWNHSQSVRLVIFADVPRRMNFMMSFINRFVLRLVEYTSHVKSIQARMKKEGIRVD